MSGEERKGGCEERGEKEGAYMIPGEFRGGIKGNILTNF